MEIRKKAKTKECARKKYSSPSTEIYNKVQHTQVIKVHSLIYQSQLFWKVMREMNFYLPKCTEGNQ